MTRVLHFSDVHVTAPFEGVPLAHFLNKRLIGLANLHLLRGRRHDEALVKLADLERFLHEQHVDVVVCTGDYTALGTEPEIALARRVIEPFTAAPGGFVTVPGNHDVYMPDAFRERRFERHFADLLVTDLPELCTDGPWPLVRLPAEGVAVIAIDSARPNPEPWLSSGRIPDAQLRGLERILSHERVRGRFVMIATHYAPRLPDGRPDSRRHGLDNADDLLAVCRGVERGVLLHGHVHHCYEVPLPDLRMRQFGAGSLSHRGREGLWVFDLEEGGGGWATRGLWRDGRFELDPESAVRL